MSDTGLGHKAARGSVWATVDRMSVMAMTFIVNMVMARLLTKSDFGLVGMVYVFTNISTVIIDGGFGSALIQKKNPTQTDYSTVFFWNVGLAAVLYILLCFAAPWISSFYHQPQLTGIVRLLGLVVIANSVFVTQFSKLRLEFRFGTLAAINIGSALLGGMLGIYLATRGLGVYALVWSQVCVGALQCVGCFALGRWFPSLTFSVATMRRLFGFGGYLLAANLLQVVCNNVQYLIIGRRFAPAQLGLYTQAQKMDQIVSYHVPQIFVQVMFPLYSKLQDDSRRLLSTLTMNMRVVAFVVFPVIALLMLLAEPVFTLLYGAKWAPAAPYFRVFCCGGFFVALQNINFYAVAARGHSRVLFRWSFYKWGVLLAFMLIGMNFGMYGMLWALVASNLNIFLTNALLASRFVGFKLSMQLRALFPVGVLTAVVAALCWYGNAKFGYSQWLTLPVFLLMYGLFAALIRLRALADFISLRRKI